MKVYSKVVAALCVGVVSMTAVAAYPDKPIQLVVPFATGGMGTNLARIVADGLTERLGKAVIVDFKPGAGGIVGFQYVKNAAPDGYTLLLGTISTASLAPSLYAKLPFDTVKDFDPIAMTFVGGNIIVVNASSPIRSLRELALEAQAKPGALNFGTTGNATTAHLLGGVFNQYQKTNIVNVAYKGIAPALTALMGDEVTVVFGGTDSLPLIRGGRLRALAVTTNARLAELPDVPTVREEGMPELTLESWYGVMAPKGTPVEVQHRLNKEISATLATPEAVARAKTLVMQVAPDTSTKYFQSRIVDEIKRWRPIIQRTGIKVD